MSIFVCDECGCIDNTACTRYWLRSVDADLKGRALCSACDPKRGKWHGLFDRRQYDPAIDRPINRESQPEPSPCPECGGTKWIERRDSWKSGPCPACQPDPDTPEAE